MKYRVIRGFMLGPMTAPYKVGDILEPQPNVAQVLIDKGDIEPIVDDPPKVETAAMETPDREVKKAQRMVRAKAC